MPTAWYLVKHRDNFIFTFKISSTYTGAYRLLRIVRNHAYATMLKISRDSSPRNDLLQK